MNIAIQQINENKDAIISFEENTLDANNAKALKERIQPILNAHQNVLLDMSNLNFLDSSGLGALLSCLRIMNNKNGGLKLYAMTKPVQALFELVRMHRIFSIYNTREEALASL